MRDGNDERVTKWKANEASCDRRMKMVGGGRMGMGVGMVGMDGMAEGDSTLISAQRLYRTSNGIVKLPTLLLCHA